MQNREIKPRERRSWKGQQGWFDKGRVPSKVIERALVSIEMALSRSLGWNGFKVILNLPRHFRRTKSCAKPPGGPLLTVLARETRDHGKINIDKEEESARVSPVTGEGLLSHTPIPKKNISCPPSIVTYNEKKPSAENVSHYFWRVRPLEAIRDVARKMYASSRTLFLQRHAFDVSSAKNFNSQSKIVDFTNSFACFAKVE